MKIHIKAVAKVGDLLIPKGEYMVAVQASGREMNLAGRGLDFKIPCIMRKAKKPIRFSDLVFYSGGGEVWHVLVKMRPDREFMATLTYVKE